MSRRGTYSRRLITENQRRNATGQADRYTLSRQRRGPTSSSAAAASFVLQSHNQTTEEIRHLELLENWRRVRARSHRTNEVAGPRPRMSRLSNEYLNTQADSRYSGHAMSRVHNPVHATEEIASSRLPRLSGFVVGSPGTDRWEALARRRTSLARDTRASQLQRDHRRSLARSRLHAQLPTTEPSSTGSTRGTTRTTFNDRIIERLPISRHTTDCNSSSTTTTTECSECVVCMNTIKEGDIIRTLPCFHKYHRQCIDRWLQVKPQCPMCRAEIV